MDLSPLGEMKDGYRALVLKDGARVQARSLNDKER